MEPADSCNTLSNRPQRGRTGARKLANFLNDLFEGEFQIKDVTFFLFLSLISEEECETGFEKWIYVLKYMEVLERLPFTAQKKIFDHLAKLADVRCLSSEEQEKYDESIKAADDYYSGLYGSYVEGEENGIAKEKIDTAYRLLSMGLSEAQVSTATELPLEEIQKMRK